MPMQTRWFFPALFAVALLAGTWFTRPAKADAEASAQEAAWEHLAMNVPVGERFATPETAKKINELGREGWQLVDVETMAKDGSTTQMVYFFKRPKSD